MAWQVMTRETAQAGNRASRTEHYLQWWENSPEWNAETSAADKRHNCSCFAICAAHIGCMRMRPHMHTCIHACIHVLCAHTHVYCMRCKHCLDECVHTSARTDRRAHTYTRTRTQPTTAALASRIGRPGCARPCACDVRLRMRNTAKRIVYTSRFVRVILAQGPC